MGKLKPPTQQKHTIPISLLKTVLKKAEYNLLILSRRAHFLKEYDDVIETEMGSAKNKISIANDVIHQMRTDMFDMLINDLTSFCERMTKKGGLLQLMKKGSHHFKLRSLNEYINEEITILDSDGSEKQMREAKEVFAKVRMEAQNAILHAMFPKAKKRKEFEVTPKDINIFIDSFKSLYKKVKTYRDNISAHRYENEKIVSQVTVRELAVLVESVEKTMNEIRLIMADSTFGYSNFFVSDTRITAQDILDLEVCGSSESLRDRMGITECNGEFFWQLRERFYKKLREDGKLPDYPNVGRKLEKRS
jgi:hypothetical protein